MKAHNQTIKNDCRAEVWTEDVFYKAEDEWQALLEQSGADQFFMSWYWMATWWKQRKTKKSTLKIIAVYQENQLIGLAPLYTETVKYFKGILASNCLQYIGKRAKGSSGIRAEYLSFILRDDVWEEALEEILTYLDAHIRWDEWYREDINQGSIENATVSQWLKSRHYYRRVDNAGISYAVECNVNFKDYCSSLGKNTRLKLFNRRKVLETMGQVEVKWLENSNIDQYVEQLNLWHQQRWNHNAFIGKNHSFLKSLFNEENGFDFSYSSMLVLDGKPLSIMINVRVGGAIYNIQLGFLEEFEKRISLGTLHIGYVLEMAFDDQGIELFDFLEGKGKYTNYKEHLATEYKQLSTENWVKNPLLKLAYLSYDKFIRNIRHRKIS